MGFFDFLSSHDDSSGDQAAGQRLLEAYFDSANVYPGFPYGNVEDMISAFEAISPGYTSDLGMTLRNAYRSTTEGEAISRMHDLADKTQGTAKIQNFFQAVTGDVNNINWAAAITDVTADSAKTLATTAQNVGQGVLSTANMLKYLPYILLAGGAFYLYLNKDLLSKVMKK